MECAFFIQTRAHPHVCYNNKEWSLLDMVLGAQLLSLPHSFATLWTVCNLSGSSVHGIYQKRILAWVAISYSRGSS